MVKACDRGWPCLPGWFWRFAPAVNKVADGHQRVSIEHSRPGITHNVANLLPSGRLVTVDLAIAAGRLFLLEGAMVETLPGIVEQTGTLVTNLSCRLVVGLTVQAKHR